MAVVDIFLPRIVDGFRHYREFVIKFSFIFFPSVSLFLSLPVCEAHQFTAPAYRRRLTSNRIFFRCFLFDLLESPANTLRITLPQTEFISSLTSMRTDLFIWTFGSVSKSFRFEKISHFRCGSLSSVVCDRNSTEKLKYRCRRLSSKINKNFSVFYGFLFPRKI